MMLLKHFSSIIWKFIFHCLINYSMVDACLLYTSDAADE